MAVTNLSTSKRGKELLLEGSCSLKMPAGWMSVYDESMHVSLCERMSKSRNEPCIFFFLFYPHDFMSLLSVTINPPRNPPNILEAQKSFTPPPVYTYPLYLSLYSYFSRSATVFPCPIPLVLSQLHPSLCWH